MTTRRRWPRGKNGDLPDWYGSDAPFVERTLDELMREENERNDIYMACDFYGSPIPNPEWQKPDAVQSALEQASRGDIAPLRALYPLISAYIHLPPMPKRRRGETKNRFRKYPLFHPAILAADTVRDIYAMWQRDYGMKNRRRSLGQSTAVDVAVAYLKPFGWKVSVRALELELWHHGRGRK